MVRYVVWIRLILDDIFVVLSEVVRSRLFDLMLMIKLLINIYVGIEIMVSVMRMVNIIRVVSCFWIVIFIFGRFW